MRSLYAKIISLGIAVLFASPLFAQDITERIELEQKIQDRLSKQIETLVPTDRFKLIINAKVSRVTERIPLEGETVSKVDATQPGKAQVVEALPGFELAEKPENKAPEAKSQNTMSKYRFSTYTKIDQVNINLVLDVGLEQQRKELVETIVRQDIDTTLGEVAKLNLSYLELTESQKSFFESISAWMTNYLDKRGGSGLDLIVIGLLALLFLWAIFTVIKKIQKMFSKSSQATTNATNSAKELDSGYAEDISINQLLDRLVDHATRSTLEVSCFLRQLQIEDKRALLDATKTPAMRSHFQNIMGLHTAPERKQGNIDKKVLDQQLRSIEKDLERFLTIQNIQVRKLFGYLPMLFDDQIVRFIEESKDKLGDLAILSKYMVKEQFDQISDRLTVDEKAEFFKLIRSATPTQERLLQLDHELRTRYERMKEQSSLISKESADIEIEFLENAEDVGELIETLKQHNVPLTPAYEKYMITFDKLLTMDKSVIREVFNRVSNETLAKAMVKQPFSEVIRECMGEMRGKLIDSTKSRYSNADKKEINQAQKDILKVYWKLV